ncbi:uncharacterized protein si:ch211-199g17.9 isoform X2 [Gadus macrocephalus]|uniref:uncharacterized protein si:ch211-199g17.9 isoform X2 n=1 Tax=Gadus macrocephalus TaxID=80720 RepID=UPI0028CB7092|nr:uncharacterized protein si:ch211-199g17.9 isoform X2 [Gadus macrocephalus]
MEELKFEQLMVKLRKHQEDKLVLDGDVNESLSVHDALLEELANLRTEAYQLKATHRDKKESCRVLKFQCRESEQESASVCLQTIAAQQAKRGDVRTVQMPDPGIKVEAQKAATPERLPSEIESAQNSKCQLLATEILKVAQLNILEEEV